MCMAGASSTVVGEKAVLQLVGEDGEGAVGLGSDDAVHVPLICATGDEPEAEGIVPALSAVDAEEVAQPRYESGPIYQ